MSTDHIPIADVSLTDAEIEAAVSVLESGYLVQGQRVAEFESAFADWMGTDYAIAVSSGTAALHLAYLLTIDPGDEVLVPALSHISTASMVEFADGTPVFCDVDPRTYTLDPADARDRITADTTAIAPVHLFGNAAQIDTILDFADEHDLIVIWDAAQAHGTMYRGADLGTLPDVVTYSFYPTKNMTTIEGGMLTTADADLAERCRLLRAHWQTEKYYHPDVGLNYRMTDVEAAIGKEQLDSLQESVAARRENARTLTRGLGDVKGVQTPFVPENVEHSFHQYTVLLVEELTGKRDAIKADVEDAGVGTAVHYPRPIHRQPAFDTTVSLPVSESICGRVMSLPVYPSLTGAELDRIVDAVAAAVERHR
jgi:perosamine synthetase